MSTRVQESDAPETIIAPTKASETTYASMPEETAFPKGSLHAASTYTTKTVPAFLAFRDTTTSENPDSDATEKLAARDPLDSSISTSEPVAIILRSNTASGESTDTHLTKPKAARHLTGITKVTPPFLTFVQPRRWIRRQSLQASLMVLLVPVLLVAIMLSILSGIAIAEPNFLKLGSKATDGSMAGSTAESTSASSSKSNSSDTTDSKADKQAFIKEWTERIDAYLEGSPMEGCGEIYAKAAYAYGIDPRWSPAISCIESSKGQNCFLPYNAWGWGDYSFSSWEEGIWTHVKGLHDYYGTSNSYAGAMKYNPPNYDEWYRLVEYEISII